MSNMKVAFILMTLIIGSSAVGKAVVNDDSTAAKPAKTQVAGNSRIQCEGALLGLLKKRYGGIEDPDSITDYPSTDLMLRYVNICRKSWRPIANLEKRLQKEGIVNPRAVLQKAASADDPSAVIKANLSHPSKAELAEWQSAFLSLQEFEKKAPATVTAEGPVSESAH